MFVSLVLVMDVVMFVSGRPLSGMRLFVMVGMGVFVTVLMGVDGVVRMSMVMGVGMDVFMCMFFFSHVSSSFFISLSYIFRSNDVVTIPCCNGIKK